MTLIEVLRLREQRSPVQFECHCYTSLALRRRERRVALSDKRCDSYTGIGKHYPRVGYSKKCGGHISYHILCSLQVLQGSFAR